MDDEYPVFFKNASNPPFIVYYYGNLSLLEKKYRLGVIGTRNPTLYQNDTVYRLISETEDKMKNDLVLVSGMARGLDQTAMEAALSKKAPVISIIGSGIDNPYPEFNKGIYDYCKTENGLVLSEYPGMEAAKPDNFVFRNRLLAMVSEVIFVGGGKNRSGTSSTVRQALDLNREIMALPCDITGDDLTNSLINDGAGSVLTSDDLVMALKNRMNIL